MEMLLSTVKRADICIELAEFASTTFAKVSCNDTEGRRKKEPSWVYVLAWMSAVAILEPQDPCSSRSTLGIEVPQDFCGSDFVHCVLRRRPIGVTISCREMGGKMMRHQYWSYI